MGRSMLGVLLLGASMARGAVLPQQLELEANFTGYQVLSMTPHCEEQVAWLLALRLNRSGPCPGAALDWWSEPGQPHASVLVSVPPGCLARVEELVGEEGIQYIVTIPDLARLIREERSYRWHIHSFHWDSQDWSPEIYHNLEEIEARLTSLISLHPLLLARQKLGTTHEGRDISAIVVRQPGPRDKPVIWLDCGIHAREWVSPPACLHAIHSLLQDSNSAGSRQNLLNAFDFYILPVANPDGYVYTWTTNRFWRKNRRDNLTHPAQCPSYPGSGHGAGVDPNRNFDADFASAPRSHCKESYRGQYAFSEAESMSIKEGISSIKKLYGKDRIAAFVSIHAYSQFWMSPMGYTWTRPKDYDDHMRVMKVATDSLTAEYGTKFKYGPISEVIYKAAGSSVDWAYENAGIKYSFGLELRDAGRMGFMLPQSEIQPTVRETWAGLKAMAWEILPEFEGPVGLQVEQGLSAGLEITFG